MADSSEDVWLIMALWHGADNLGVSDAIIGGSCVGENKWTCAITTLYIDHNF